MVRSIWNSFSNHFHEPIVIRKQAACSIIGGDYFSHSSTKVLFSDQSFPNLSTYLAYLIVSRPTQCCFLQTSRLTSIYFALQELAASSSLKSTDRPLIPIVLLHLLDTGLTDIGPEHTSLIGFWTIWTQASRRKKKTKLPPLCFINL